MAINNAVNANSAGFQSITSGGVWNGRTLVAGTGISISNGDGTAGNPTITNTVSGGTGSVVQQVRTSSTSSVSSTKILAATGTTPTTSNTDSIITLAVTPTNSSNVLIFEFTTPYSGGTVGDVSFCLFSGTTFVTGFPYNSSGSGTGTINYTFSFMYYMVAGGTSPVTFDVRWAANDAGVAIRTLQSSAGTPLAFYNSAITSTQLVITEVTP